MTDQSEPKMTTEELVDKVLGSGEQPEASSLQTEQQVQTEGNVSDTVKTQNPTVEAEGKKQLDPVPYEKFSDVYKQNKEARELLKSKEAEVEAFSKLLDDPLVYQRWLKSQGFSDAQIQDAMRQKGMASQEPQNVKESTAQSIAEKACKKLGWDISRLTSDQRVYIQDHVDLSMAAVEDYVKSEMDKRLGPMEQITNEYSFQKQVNAEETAVKELASKEFPNLKWEDVQKAINDYCNDLDKKDPQRTLKFSYEDLYYRATRPLLREQEVVKRNQEARKQVKANARPLGTGPSTNASGEVTKKPPVHEFLESKLDEMGIR